MNCNAFCSIVCQNFSKFSVVDVYCLVYFSPAYDYLVVVRIRSWARIMCYRQSLETGNDRVYRDFQLRKSIMAGCIFYSSKVFVKLT